MAVATVATPRTAPRTRSERKVSHRKRLDTRAALLFLAPNVILASLFLLLPLGWALVLSFQNSSGFSPTTWAGLANYANLVRDPVFWQSTFNTALFTIITVPLSMGLGLAVASLLNSVLPARGLFRTVFLIPIVISGVATSLVGVLMFDENLGIINEVDRLLGGSGIHWQSGGGPAMASVILVTLWVRVGFNMLIYLAGLQGISPSLYEAATLEGATGWKKFRWITFPLLGPSTFFLLIMNVIYSFQVFDTVYVMTGGGPGNSTTLLVNYAYNNGFVTRAQGYAAAIGVVLLLFTLVFTALQWKLNRSKDATE